MASPRKKRAPKADVAALVIFQRGEGGSVWTLPTNPGYTEPNEIDSDRGVEPESPDARLGEQAITARVLHDLVPARLRQWIAERMGRHGGLAGLTRELMAMRSVPAGRDPEKYRKALLRSLERSGPSQKPGRREEHGGIKNPEYRSRIALLILRDQPVALAVYGRWLVEGDRRGAHYSWFYSDPYDVEQAQYCRDILAADGTGMIDLIEGIAQHIIGGSRTITLEMCHALKVETRD